MSGHSKWANIKHKKGRADAKRGKVFTQISKEITIAAREGIGDPDFNPRLRLAVQNAKAVNMPNENIKRAIQKGTGEIEGIVYEEAIYEGYAPLGVAVILEVVTDNKKRTVAELRSQFGKLGGSLGEPGSVAWNFDRKGVVTINSSNEKEEDLFDLVIEAGAEDLDFGEETSRIICPYETLNLCSKYLEDKKKEITQSKLEFIPKNIVNIDNIDDARRLLKFIDTFEEHEDVQYVYSNFEIDDSIVDALEE
ncbi:MAG: hypothetical protein HW421_479 [Ignavibacteria bacterium]|nr:hypothetical protein [Ignavibacteria bacterium]